ncbi:O-antigen ligase [Acinetobacter lwoffii]|jgi:O-antigen ligase|uniref:O-antigen ligase n=1 Tax=Acinetobacter lwoffii TaxID=28090 RepID=A0AAW8LGX6_ACILW|nr:Wzy polymerase domain-containing protein [Acinetobacter lwoffii]MDR6629075.1 O-antigen ligase [Acinetobacter lwoffii]
MILEFFKKYLFIFLFGMAYLYGVISPQHYSPSSHDFYINTICFIIVLIGLFFFFFNKEIKINYSNLIWVLIFFIILLQPLFNNIIYVDALIFPLSVVFVCFLISILGDYVKENYNIKYILLILSGFFVVGAFLLFITQLAHVFKLNEIVDFFGLPLQYQRFSGNLYQSNQTAFVFVLGILSVIFLASQIKKYKYLTILYIFSLGIGVALTSSRVGVLMLILLVLMYNIYLNNKNHHFLKFNYTFSAFTGLFSGIILYNFIASNDQIIQRTLKAVDDPRISLFKQSFYIIKDNPFFGVGWKNFSSTNLEYYHHLDWISITDHSHNLFTQLLAEFGFLFGGMIIGYFFWVFLRGIFLNKFDSIKFYILMVLLVFLFYSIFEFPLWYFRYIFIFSLFLSFFSLDGKNICIIKKPILISVTCFCLSIVSVFYLVEYRKIATTNSILNDINIAQKDKFIKVANMSNVIGFSSFRDQLLFSLVTPDGFMLEEAISLGDRVTKYTPTREFLVKQGTLLALNGDTTKAISYFNLACKYDWNAKCSLIRNDILQLYKAYPSSFEDIVKRVN